MNTVESPPQTKRGNAAVRLCRLLLILLGSSLSLSAQNGSSASCRLTVTVPNVRSTEGQLRLSLYRGPNGFPGDPKAAMLLKNLPATAPTQTFAIADLPPGDYAIAVTHDENGNGKLDTKFFGIPREGVGVSNNPKPRMGPPSYQSASFTLHEPEHAIEIKLLY